MVSLRVTRLTKSQLNNQKKPEEEDHSNIFSPYIKITLVAEEKRMLLYNIESPHLRFEFDHYSKNNNMNLC